MLVNVWSANASDNGGDVAVEVQGACGCYCFPICSYSISCFPIILVNL